LFLISAAFVRWSDLIVLIAVFKLNPFITLLAHFAGPCRGNGNAASTVVHSFEAGVGATLGHIAIVVALGTMLGKMMAESEARTRLPHAYPLSLERREFIGP
jgi:GntP family gluconate:H+ symporter